MTRPKIELPKIDFGSDLTALIVELERVRSKYDQGTTPPGIFFEVKNLFQLLTSMISARIEGNHTTIVDALEAINEESDTGVAAPEDVREINNIQAGIDFIEKHVHDRPIDKAFICELHRIVVNDLTREGDERPGGYRRENVTIAQSSHRPPHHADVEDHMTALIEFINRADGTQFDLLKDAVAHHRFVWIHPFSNGNGRVARLLTYAMMAKQGFIDSSGVRVLNPTAVFGSNRNEYYEALARADSLKDKEILAWAEYMLSGVKADLDKVEKLQDAKYVRTEIIMPALKSAHDKGRLSAQEYAMLVAASKKESVTARDFDSVINKSASHVVRSQAIRKLREARLLRPLEEGGRRYTLQLIPNAITSHIMRQLDENGLLPEVLRD
jgi:Fic family protein